jgi:hypothetical protein
MIMMAHDIVLMGDMDVIAKKYGVTPNYIRSLMQNNKEFQQVLDDFCEVVIKEVKTSVVGHAQEALDVVLEIMNDSEVQPQHRLSAARDVLDRAGASTEKSKGGNDTVVNIVLNKDMFGEADRKTVEADFTAEDAGDVDA